MTVGKNGSQACGFQGAEATYIRRTAGAESADTESERAEDAT
jgi:hypothetical protein